MNREVIAILRIIHVSSAFFEKIFAWIHNDSDQNRKPGGQPVKVLIFLLSNFIYLSTSAWPIDAFASTPKLIPPSPRYYVFDEPDILSPHIETALQRLLIEHDRLTGEQILIAIFNGLENVDPIDFTHRVYSNWRIGTRGKNNGALMAVYWSERKARIEVGFGLEPILTASKCREIVEDILIPEIREGNPGSAFSLAVLEILTVLESPLIQSGKAQEILHSAGTSTSLGTAKAKPRSGWPLWLFLGALLLLMTLGKLLSAEAHYTRDGWYHPKPWHRGWKPGTKRGLPSGGGASGTW